jgi:hypothetical protein
MQPLMYQPTILEYDSAVIAVLLLYKIASAGNGSGGGGAMDTLQDSHDQIILALIAIISVSIGALVYTIKNNALGKDIAKNAYEANKAVNNIGPGEHRLYEVIARIEAKQDEFDRKWGNLPADMDDAVGLAELLHGMDQRVARIEGKQDQMQGQLIEHVAWEMAQKYPGSD